MSNLGAVIAIMISAFVTGALARLAVPGPDPMPAWLTVAIGLVGSVCGGAIAVAAFGRNATAVGVGSFLAAVLLVVAYRKLVQKRPLVGIEAMRFPRRGVGVREYRDRLNRAGVDPDALLDRAIERRGEDEDEPPRDREP
jgi:uncharacterized membrane protein YeaQ/YmgE (transglycosylase-associated protein family)